jgi:hypothetical protein
MLTRLSSQISLIVEVSIFFETLLILLYKSHLINHNSFFSSFVIQINSSSLIFSSKNVEKSFQEKNQLSKYF